MEKAPSTAAQTPSTSRLPSPSPGRRIVACLGLILGLGLCGVSQADGPQLTTSVDGKAFLSWVDDHSLELPLAKGSLVSSPAVVGEEWWITATERTAKAAPTRLVVLHGQGQRVLSTSYPIKTQDPVLFGAQPIVDSQGLRAVLWLEGTAVRQSRVEVALYQDGTWSAPTTVSPRGSGTQTALRVAVLNDDSWLAVWSAFDGNDDEILWSRYHQGAWSTPAAVAPNNQVPDITPHVVATTDGALIAWSRFDGRDYRVTVSSFDLSKSAESPWSKAQTVGGRGTVYPEFLHRDTKDSNRQPLLLFRQAVPAAWTVLEVDKQGQPQRQAQALTSAQQAPSLVHQDGQSVELRWATIDTEKGFVAERKVVVWESLLGD